MALRVLSLNAIFSSSVYLSNKSDSSTLLTHLGIGGVKLDSDSLEVLPGLDSSTLAEVVSTLTEDWVVSGTGVPPLGSAGSGVRCETDLLNSSSTPTGGK